MSDIVRVLRVIEYSGPRHLVEAQLKNSLADGERQGHTSRGESCIIRVGTIGTFPEILQPKEPA